MTTITVSNAAQLTTALKSAQAGDTISLAAGNYGDVSINNYNTSVTITSQNANSPAVFHSISVNSSSNIHIDDVNVAFTPGANTYAWSSAVSFSNSSNITFTHSIVTGGLAVNGVAPTATALDASGNVQGYPTGYGINISNSNNVKVDSVDISTVNKGIVLNNATNTTISHDSIHDMRTSGIVSGGGSNITIDSNHIYDSHPWNWGNTPIGDHADFLAMWTNAGQSAASSNITITNNLMEQGSGTAVLGMWMQGGTAGFTNVKISGNAFLNGNFQGITLTDVSGGSIDHNTMLQTSGSDWRSAPGILLTSGTQNIAVTANTTGSVNDQSGSTGALANTVSANTLVQKWLATSAGYYDSTLIAKLDAAFGVVSLDSVYSPTTTTTTTTTTAPAVTTAPAAATTTTAPAAVTDAVAATPDTGGHAGVTITGGWSPSVLTGGSGNDTIVSRVAGDTLVGGSGDDTFYVIGGSGTKTTIIEGVGGGTDTVITKGDFTLPDNVENLTISDTATNNWAGTGNALNNVILGNAGNNVLDGGAGNDTINGGAGNDTIIGGTGDDYLIGGAGKDTFRFVQGSGHDTIADFNAVDHDVIDISAYLKAGLKPILTDVGSNVNISFSTGDVITLVGVHAKDLIATSAGFTI